MSVVDNNSTRSLLPAGGVFQGKTYKPDSKYITVQVSFQFQGSLTGRLEVYYSLDGLYFDNYGDTWDYVEGHYFKETALKGNYFYVKFTNTGSTSQTKFDLHTKLTPSVSTVSVDGVINIPEVNVNVDGETLFARLRDADNNDIGSYEGNLYVIDNNSVSLLNSINNKTPTGLTLNGDKLKVDIDGQRVLTDISGQHLVVNTISGFALDSTLGSANTKLDTINTSINNKHLLAINDSVTIGDIAYGAQVGINNFPVSQTVSGSVIVSNLPSVQAVSGTFWPITQPVSGSVTVNTISGYSTSALQTTGNNLLNDIKAKTLNSAADSVTVWAGNDDFKIRNLSATVDNVDVGLSNYAYSNSNPPFPASRDVLSVQVVGVHDVSGTQLVNLVSNTDGHLITSVDNFPTTTEISNVVDVSGTVSVSSLPSITIANTGFNVNNFPTTTEISNVVDVSGTVSVSSLPSITIANTGFNVNNFPTSTEVSNVVDISGSVSVSSLPSITIANTGFNVNNFPTSTEVSNVVDISGSVSVSSLPSITIANTGFNVNNFPTSTEVSNVVDVSGTFWPTTQQVSGSVNIGNFPSSTNAHLQAYDPSLTNYFDLTSTGIGLHTSALDVAVKNTIDVSGVFYPSIQPVSGSVAVSNQITGFMTEITGDNINIAVNRLNSDTTNPDAIQVQIKNSSLDSHMYGSTNGTTWHHLACDSNGQLNVHAKLQDDAGNALNSTSNALNTYITNSSIPVTGTVTANIASNQTVLSNVYDYQHNGITSTNHTAFKYGLDTTAALATTDMTNRYLLTSTSDGGSKRGLDVNIASGSISVSSVNIKDSSGNSLTSTSNNLDVNVKAYSRTDAATTNLTSVQPVGAGATNTKALETYSYLVGLNNSSNIPLQITTTNTAYTQSMDCFINNETTATSGGAIAGYTATGLNTYQILPKMKSFAVSGINNYATTGALMAGQGSTMLVNTYRWGKANADKTFYLYTPTGTPSASPVKTISYTYINSAGNEMTATATSLLNGGYVPLQSNIVGVNNFSMTNNFQFGATDNYYITLGNASGVATAVCSVAGTHYSMQNGIFTVPNNAIAMVTSIDAVLGTSNDYYYMNIWDASGNRDVAWVGYMYASNVNNMRTAGGGDYGCIGRILKAGETVAFHTYGTTSTNKNVLANIKVLYF